MYGLAQVRAWCLPVIQNRTAGIVRHCQATPYAHTTPKAWGESHPLGVRSVVVIPALELRRAAHLCWYRFLQARHDRDMIDAGNINLLSYPQGNMMALRKSPVQLDWIDPAACTLDYRLKIIGRLSFFKHLPPEAIKDINRRFHDRSYAAGQAVYFEGDAAEHLHLVAMGRVKLIRDAGSGHEVLLDILHGGEYFGNLQVFGTPVHNETAIAYADCCILNISSEDFEAILRRYPDVTLKLLSAVGKRLEDSREQRAQLSTYTVEQRIAAALLRLAGKAGEARGQSVLIQLPLSRQDLAAMTGTTTETVSRVMSRFAKQGLVRSGRKWVAVADEQGLEELIKRVAVN